jgi:hypothetical protein
MRDRSKENNFLAGLMYNEHINYIRGKKQPLCDALRRSMVMSPAGLFAPCIEFTTESAELDIMRSKRMEWFKRCDICNSQTPCFYNCAREIGIIWRNKWRIAAHIPHILRQMARYRSFF